MGGRPARPRSSSSGTRPGGQYVNRYAAVGRGPEHLAERGIAVRFVISNPSTYLYFTGDYRWRYGFDGAPAYVEGDARENLRRYLARDVTIVLGQEDRDGAALLLETGAAAMAQGANRYERGIRYHAYVSELARGDGLESRHRLIRLDGVGHAAADVMAAEPVRDILSANPCPADHCPANPSPANSANRCRSAANRWAISRAGAEVGVADDHHAVGDQGGPPVPAGRAHREQVDRDDVLAVGRQQVVQALDTG